MTDDDTNEVWIYGYSDDLVEVDGDATDEFYGGQDPTIVRISAGFSSTLIRVVYQDDATWSVEDITDSRMTTHYDVGDHDWCNYSEAVRFESSSDIDVDEHITLRESSSKYRDFESDEVSLSKALNTDCPECGGRITWVLDPDPDSLQYYSDNECECGRRYYIQPTKATVEAVEVDE